MNRSMRRIILAIVLSVSSAFGISQVQLPAIESLFDYFIPAANASPFVTNTTGWELAPIPFCAGYLTNVEVGALRPPSQHYSWDRFDTGSRRSCASRCHRYSSPSSTLLA